MIEKGGKEVMGERRKGGKEKLVRFTGKFIKRMFLNYL